MDIMRFQQTKYITMIFAVHEHPDCNQGQLCGIKALCDRTKQARLVQLVEDGLVEQTERKTYRLTSAGLQVLTLLRAIEAIPTEKRVTVPRGDQSTG